MLYDEDCLYINKTGFIILSDAPKYLLGILNSRLLDYFYRQEFPAWGDPWAGGRVQFRGDRMAEVPIPEPSAKDREAIERWVDQTISAKLGDPEADLSSIEREIDQRVYKLYRLTAEEIRIIEESTGKR